MVGVVKARPADATGLGLLDGRLGGVCDAKMAHAVVAVDERCRGHVALDCDVGGRVEPASLQAADIAGQPEDAMGILAQHVRLGHEMRNLRRILVGQVGGAEAGGHESLDLVAREPLHLLGVVWHWISSRNSDFVSLRTLNPKGAARGVAGPYTFATRRNAHDAQIRDRL